MSAFLLKSLCCTNICLKNLTKVSDFWNPRSARGSDEFGSACTYVRPSVMPFFGIGSFNSDFLNEVNTA